MFIAALFNNSQKVETTHVSIDWWMNKEKVVCPYNGILSCIWLIYTASWMNLGNITYTPWSQCRCLSPHVCSVLWVFPRQSRTVCGMNEKHPFDVWTESQGSEGEVLPACLKCTRSATSLISIFTMCHLRSLGIPLVLNKVPSHWLDWTSSHSKARERQPGSTGSLPHTSAKFLSPLLSGAEKQIAAC